MGRIGITYNDVTQAIATIHGKQQNATVDRVREVLGTGSRTTIANLLREWKEKNNILPTDPTGMPIELLNLVKSLWETLQNKTEEQLLEERKIINADSNQLRQTLQEQAQTVSTLKKQNHSLEELNTDLSHKLNITQNKLQQTDVECNRLKERLSAMTRQQEKYDKEQQRLHDLLEHVQNNLEHYQNSSQQLRHEQIALLEKHRNEYEQKTSQLQTQVHTARQQAFIAEQSNTILKESLAQSEKSLQDIFISNQKNKSARDQLTAKYDLLTEQYQELQRSYEEKTQHATILEEKYLTEKNSFTKTQEELQQALDKIKALRHDYQFFGQEKAGLQGQVELLKGGAIDLLKTG